MFEKSNYIKRRRTLAEKVGHGLIVLPGNNESPANYTNNAYAPFRQDSSFLYFFGQKREGLVGVIDAESGESHLFGDDIDIDDIIWYGAVDSVADMAAMVGVEKTGTFQMFVDMVTKARSDGRAIHFLPPYRFDHKLLLQQLLGLEPTEQREKASVRLIKAIVDMRSTKSKEEIAELEKACEIGYKMHTTAMKLCRPGVSERFISGVIGGIAESFGSMVSFPSIVTMHGEILHGTPSETLLEPGRLMLCDAGAETLEHYCSDNTRTTPISGKFTLKQREIYTIVEQCHDLALRMARPGMMWKEVHMAVCRHIIECMKALGLMKGNTDDALAAGAHALFMPHGLGHMMGMDVHDMEALGQEYVGFDDEVRPSAQFGLASLRMGRGLQPGFVVTDEPGLYFIPALIDLWRVRGINAEYLNFDAIENYKDFGGIRIEDDVLVTENGARFLGKQAIPYHIRDVEEFIEKNRC